MSDFSADWVSVNDAMPRHEGDYIGTDGDRVDLCRYYKAFGFVPETHDPEYFQKVTHYMELPEPPK